MTLWRLPADLEDDFDAQWERWIEVAPVWQPVFQQIERFEGTDLIACLKALDLISESDLDSFARLKRSAEGRAVPLPGMYRPDDAVLTLLALGFARGEPGAPAIPYARLDE